ncbi:MAG: hypothetical protein D6710_06845 [Nitrospirae bacterium]|nr:MAG: hypothetical protein D6710_06845 [Nitrospirota bacterium]
MSKDLKHIDYWVDHEIRNLNDSLFLFFSSQRVEVSSTYTLSDKSFLAVNSQQAINIYLGAANDYKGRFVIIKDEGGYGSIANITIIPRGIEKIDGNSSYVINTNYGSVRLYSNGSHWFTV